MCFTYDNVYDVSRATWRKARKTHNCSGCGNVINPGELYLDCFGVVRGERPDRWNECEACRYHRALVYACEIADGCRPFESWYPLDIIHDEMHERGWYVPGLTSDTWQPRDDNDNPCGGVVRFGQWRDVQKLKEGV